MANAGETEKAHTKQYMDAYERLTRVLTNMYATERRALDESQQYNVIMELVVHGRDSEAVELALQFRDERGDQWREKAHEIGRIPTSDFVNTHTTED